MSRTTTNRYNIHFFLLITILVCLFIFGTVGFTQDTPEKDTEILKKITTMFLTEVIDSSHTLEELAARVGVTVPEVEQICFALGIDLSKYRMEIDLAIALDIEMLRSDEYEPEVIIEHQSDSPYVLLVDKSTHSLYVLKYEQGNRSLVTYYDCKTGMEIGDKQEAGDLKTPEGIYFFTGKLMRDEIQSWVGMGRAFQYGEMAFTTDFPNSIDRLKKKNGDGIWLHGTDETFSETSPMDTQGCVVTTNETVRMLEPYITLNRTPMIIVDELTFILKSEYEQRKREYLALLWGWRDAWLGEDIDRYIDYYSADFSTDGRNLTRWKDYKASIFRAVKINRIDLSDIVFMKYRDGLVIQFGQEYAASNLRSYNVKALYLVPVGSTWKIIAEDIQR